MALKVIWSPQAIDTFAEIVDYLQTNWTEREIKKFVQKSNVVIELINQNPKMYKASEKKKYHHKAFIFKPVSLVYRHKPKKQEIELVTFWNKSKNKF